MPSDGPIVESDLVATLAQIAELARRHRAGEPGGHPIDVLNLSMGYYHETPEDALFDPTMYGILEEMSRNGVVIVCSAGNDATSRPLFPAAFGRWADDSGPIPFDSTIAPILSVGAQNPNRTDALFSNAGPWVRAYVPGAAVLSTMPAFRGGYEPIARTKTFGRVREAIDPDDFSGGLRRVERDVVQRADHGGQRRRRHARRARTHRRSHSTHRLRSIGLGTRYRSVPALARS